MYTHMLHTHVLKLHLPFVSIPVFICVLDRIMPTFHERYTPLSGPHRFT